MTSGKEALKDPGMDTFHSLLQTAYEKQYGAKIGPDPTIQIFNSVITNEPNRGTFDFIHLADVAFCKNVIDTLQHLIQHLKPEGKLFIEVSKQEGPLTPLDKIIASFATNQPLQADPIVNSASLLACAQFAAEISGRTGKGIEVPSRAKLQVVLTCSRADTFTKEAAEFLQMRHMLAAHIPRQTLALLEGKSVRLANQDHADKAAIVSGGRVRWIMDPSLVEPNNYNGENAVSIDLGRVLPEAFGEQIAPDWEKMGEQRNYEVASRLPPGAGLEISPGGSPLLDKKSFDVRYCDKFDAQTYAKLYPNSQIIDVDFVIGNRPLDEALEGLQFAYIVSSHVIEHIPDFIQFFISASKLLAPGGVIVMLAPDKRYTFDALRRLTSIQDIELAHAAQLFTPSWAMIEEFYRNCDMGVTDPGKMWDRTHPIRPSHSPDEATACIKRVDPKNKPDVHCHVFTPQTFRTLVEHVCTKYTPDLRVISIKDTLPRRNEFLVHLGRK